MKYNLEFVRKQSRKKLEETTNKNCFTDITLSCREYENAIAVPANLEWEHYHAGIIDSNGKVIRNSKLYETMEEDWVSHVSDDDVKYSDEEVIYIGWISPTWGHLLTDCLKKIWFLKTQKCKELLSGGGKVVAIIPWPNKTIREIFRLADVDIDSVTNIKEITKYKRIYIPDNSIIEAEDGSRTYTNEYVDVVNTIVSKIPSTGSSGKIYFSRTSFTDQKTIWIREFGEKIIEKVFKDLGYKIVYPEQGTVMGNLELIRNCDVFASTEGSVSHNALFCKPGTEVIIVRKVDYINTWQLFINQIANVNVTYIDAHRSIVSNGWLGPFYLCITRELERFVGKTMWYLPYYTRPSFWWYYIENRRIVNKILRPLFK